MFFSLVLFFSCAHRITFPGPTHSVGDRPKTYAERYGIEVLESSNKDSVIVQSTDKKKRRNKKNHAGEDVADVSVSYIGKTKLRINGTLFRYDCSGLVEAMYFAAGKPISGSAKMMYEQSKENRVFHKDKIPMAGDLVFFDNTHDRNKNGRRDDKLTHVAIVESVNDSGTISIIHLGSRGISRIFMNLYDPDAYKDDQGNIMNSFLRAPSKDKGPRLTGELFVGFGSLWRVEPPRPASMLLDESSLGIQNTNDL
jgi:peptidoglycan DL-endopeptidase CwlO